MRRIATLLLTTLVPHTLTAEWSQFGGPGRDFALDQVPEIADWGEAGPRALWQRDLGPGYAGLIADSAGGRLITLTRDGEQEIVLALDAATGETVWEHRYDAPVAGLQGVSMAYGNGPQATPLLADGRVFSLGFTGRVRALDAATGRPLWAADLGAEHGAAIPYFGHAASPLRIDDPAYPEGHAVVFIAGGALAFHPKTGELLWENRSFDASYASPILADTAFGRQIVAAVAGEVVGLDPRDGALLWRHEYANPHRTILGTPILVEPDLLFVSVYFRGSRGLRLVARDRVEMVWEQPDFQVSQFNAVRRGAALITTFRRNLLAIDAGTGEVLWNERRFGAANLVTAGASSVVLGDLGQLSIVHLDGRRVETRQSARILEDRSWTPPTLIGGRMYVRDQRVAAAYDLGTAAAPVPVDARRAAASVAAPEAFRAGMVAIHRAALRGQPEGVERAASELAAWADDAHLGTWSAYHRAFGFWQTSFIGDNDAQLAALDRAVELAKRAVELDRENAEAHALLATLYPGYYRLSPGRAAVVGPLGDEHLARANDLAADNLRVRAISGLDLASTPPQWGGDPQRGRQRLADVIDGLGTVDAFPEPADARPVWGPAMVRLWLANLLASSEPKDEDRARALLDQALTLLPDFAAARTLRDRLSPGASD